MKLKHVKTFEGAQERQIHDRDEGFEILPSFEIEGWPGINSETIKFELEGHGKYGEKARITIRHGRTGEELDILVDPKDLQDLHF